MGEELGDNLGGLLGGYLGSFLGCHSIGNEKDRLIIAQIIIQSQFENVTCIHFYQA